MDENTNIGEAIAAGTALAGALSVPRDDKAARFVVIPEGYKVEDLERMMATPPQTRVVVKCFVLDSLIAYLSEYKTAATKVFCAVTMTGVTFVAVIDFDAPSSPAWRKHKAEFSAVLTPEWKYWMAHNGVKMNQKDFAEFLEEMQKYIVTPNGSDLLEMIQSLEGHVNAKFKSEKRIANGKRQLEYVEDVELRGQSGEQAGAIEMPEILELGLKPFEGGSSYKMGARLRYRISGGEVTFEYKLIDPHLVIKDAVYEMITTLEQKCGIKALQGAIA